MSELTTLRKFGEKLGNGGSVVAVYRALTVTVIVALGGILWSGNGTLARIETLLVGQQRDLDRMDGRLLYLERRQRGITRWTEEAEP